jgi:AraC family transcriptional regulator
LTGAIIGYPRNREQAQPAFRIKSLDGLVIEPTFIDRGPLILAGFSFFGDPFRSNSEWTEENEIGRLWQRLMRFGQQHLDKLPPFQNPKITYEVHIEHEETPRLGFFEVFAGLEISVVAELPVQILVKVLPATRYAVFTLRGLQITSDWWFTVYQEWLPVSGYRIAHPYTLQVYDERFKGLDRLEESLLEVHFPVQRLGAPE